MAHLDWIGKRAVLNHHREIPFRLLRCDPKLSVGVPDAGNLLVQGDNLHALKALLPHYGGRVKCVYIDPPYNTGNEGWSYNDNSNAPEIKAWLGKVVGKEAEDLSRHDKWLCMMYPRLSLLREFLTDDGAIFISIDDNEVHTLRMLCDEIFGRQNFVTTFIWQKVDSPNDNKVPITPDHEYILCYTRLPGNGDFRKLGDESVIEAYGQIDESGRRCRDRLLRKNGKNSLRSDRPTMFFKLIAPDGTEVYPIHDDGREGRWSHSPVGIKKIENEKRLIWKQRQREKDGEFAWVPYAREFAPETPTRPHPTILLDVKTSRQAKAHHRDLFPTSEPFDTIKPEQLLERILNLCTDPGDLVLDAFAGSGTTLAVAKKMGRRWIGIEMEDHVETIIQPRMKAVIEGEQGGISESAAWEGGGGFRYCRLADPLFDAYGSIRPEVKFADLAAHIYFSETGSPMSRKRENSPLFGVHNGVGIYLLFNGILGDKRPEAGNILTPDILDDLPPHKGTRVIYGEGTTLGSMRLRSEGIVFKQVPYQVRTR